jgi:hypothetical protein
MGTYMGVLLLVTMDDAGEEGVRCRPPSPVEMFNTWLHEEWPDTKPQLTATELLGVYTASVHNAGKGGELIDKFRELPWCEPFEARLMLREDGEDRWLTYKISIEGEE